MKILYSDSISGDWGAFLYKNTPGASAEKAFSQEVAEEVGDITPDRTKTMLDKHEEKLWQLSKQLDQYVRKLPENERDALIDEVKKIDVFYDQQLVASKARYEELLEKKNIEDRLNSLVIKFFPPQEVKPQSEEQLKQKEATEISVAADMVAKNVLNYLSKEGESPDFGCNGEYVHLTEFGDDVELELDWSFDEEVLPSAQLAHLNGNQRVKMIELANQKILKARTEPVYNHLYKKLATSAFVTKGEQLSFKVDDGDLFVVTENGERKFAETGSAWGGLVGFEQERVVKMLNSVTPELSKNLDSKFNVPRLSQEIAGKVMAYYKKEKVTPDAPSGQKPMYVQLSDFGDMEMGVEGFMEIIDHEIVSSDDLKSLSEVQKVDLLDNINAQIYKARVDQTIDQLSGLLPFDEAQYKPDDEGNVLTLSGGDLYINDDTYSGKKFGRTGTTWGALSAWEQQRVVDELNTRWKESGAKSLSPSKSAPVVTSETQKVSTAHNANAPKSKKETVSAGPTLKAVTPESKEINGTFVEPEYNRLHSDVMTAVQAVPGNKQQSIGKDLFKILSGKEKYSGTSGWLEAIRAQVRNNPDKALDHANAILRKIGEKPLYVSTLDSGSVGRLIVRNANGRELDARSQWRFLQGKSSPALTMVKGADGHPQTIVDKKGNLMVRVKGEAISKSGNGSSIVEGYVSIFYLDDQIQNRPAVVRRARKSKRRSGSSSRRSKGPSETAKEFLSANQVDGEFVDVVRKRGETEAQYRARLGEAYLSPAFLQAQHELALSTGKYEADSTYKTQKHIAKRTGLEGGERSHLGSRLDELKNARTTIDLDDILKFHNPDRKKQDKYPGVKVTGIRMVNNNFIPKNDKELANTIIKNGFIVDLKVPNGEVNGKMTYKKKPIRVQITPDGIPVLNRFIAHLDKGNTKAAMQVILLRAAPFIQAEMGHTILSRKESASENAKGFEAFLGTLGMSKQTLKNVIGDEVESVSNLKPGESKTTEAIGFDWAGIDVGSGEDDMQLKFVRNANGTFEVRAFCTGIAPGSLKKYNSTLSPSSRVSYSDIGKKGLVDFWGHGYEKNPSFNDEKLSLLVEDGKKTTEGSGNGILVSGNLQRELQIMALRHAAYMRMQYAHNYSG